MTEEHATYDAVEALHRRLMDAENRLAGLAAMVETPPQMATLESTESPTLERIAVALETLAGTVAQIDTAWMGTVGVVRTDGWVENGRMRTVAP